MITMNTWTTAGDVESKRSPADPWSELIEWFPRSTKEFPTELVVRGERSQRFPNLGSPRTASGGSTLRSVSEFGTSPDELDWVGSWLISELPLRLTEGVLDEEVSTSADPVVTSVPLLIDERLGYDMVGYDIIGYHTQVERLGERPLLKLQEKRLWRDETLIDAESNVR